MKLYSNETFTRKYLPSVIGMKPADGLNKLAEADFQYTFNRKRYPNERLITRKPENATGGRWCIGEEFRRWVKPNDKVFFHGEGRLHGWAKWEDVQMWDYFETKYHGWVVTPGEGWNDIDETIAKA